MRPLICLPAEEIVQQDSSPVGLFFITEGSVDVVDGGEIVATLRDGDFFGEGSMLENGPRNCASIIAKDYVNLMVLYQADFRQLAAEHPQIAAVIDEIKGEQERQLLNLEGTAIPGDRGGFLRSERAHAGFGARPP